MLPLAIEVGMTPNQFWYDDINLLDAYVVAYNNRNDNNAKLAGFYNHIAVVTAVRAVLGEKDGTNYWTVVNDVKNKSEEKAEGNHKNLMKKVNFWSKIKRTGGQ